MRSGIDAVGVLARQIKGENGFGAEMVDRIGDTATAAAWRACAEVMRSGINTRLTSGNKWDMSKKGFYHDPVPTMLSDLYGYDSADMSADWLARSRATYAEDIASVKPYGYVGASGIGYDHCMITQNALLLEMTADATHLVEALSKITYAPRLPEPYLIPEAVSYDSERGIYRRQGDPANLVQQAEAMKCYPLVAGVSPLTENTLKIFPRLPEGWNLDLTDFSVQNSDLILNMSTVYPVNGKQSAAIHIEGDTTGLTLQFRFGPFAESDTPALSIIGTCAEYTLNAWRSVFPLRMGRSPCARGSP